ncbi:MAG: exo-beta-N-acetylmuramidase NamZ domain-containing protein, partial [Thermoanaerobaculia bacterium]
DEAWRRTMAEEVLQRPGSVFRYSDINYILLGEIVHRVSGEPLDQFARKRVFEPLGMTDSRFLPMHVERRATPRGESTAEVGRRSTIAPTEMTDGVVLRGVVHDPTSRRMGGVAGHAGLFTTASDLAKFARALLNGGGGVFTTETVKQMTSVQSPPGSGVRRAGGFDIDSGFSRPRGELFPIGSFGHTGWTGGMMWIDPYSRTFYVFLSNRVHPYGRGNVLSLQRDLGTLVAQSVRGFDFTNVPAALPKRAGGGVRVMTGGADVQNGIDVLASSRYAALRGMRAGLITNHTGIDRAGNPTIDLLRSAPGVSLVALFSPEHGIRGVADEKVGNTTDEVTGLPIYSLYGERRKPSPEQLANLDALVFDIQDIGARFYTYISTLGMAMEAVSGTKVKFFVLDRVNPIGGVVIEGPVLEGETDFVGYHPITIRHAMTVGELAKMFRDEKHLDVDLNIVEVKGWKREMWQDESGLPWINTSPNMRSLTEAALYPGIGLLESALSVGRGTPTPFEVAGAPYIDGERLARELTALALPGVAFRPVRFTPDASIHKGEVCGGVRIAITDRNALRSVDAGIAIATILQRDYPGQFPLDKIQRLLRHKPTFAAIRAGKSLDEIHALWSSDFAERRAKYLMY